MNTSDEISLHQILQIFTRRWKILLMLGLVFTLGALTKHKYLPTYPGVGKLIIKDVRNSQLQSIIGHAAGMSAEVAEPELKGDDLTVRAEALLDIHDFYVGVTNRLLSIKHEVRNPALDSFFSSVKKPEDDPEFVHEAANRIATMINFNTVKGDILTVEAKSGNRDFTVMLVNETLREAQKKLTERELDDLNRAENYFKLEIAEVRGRLDSIENLTVKKMQKSQILSVDMEKGESAKYMSELKKNINDTKILMTNNNERILELKNKIKKSPSINVGLSKFNEASQIKSLEEQNRDLSMELKTNENYLKNFELQKNGLVPFQYEIEKMNASHDFEYKVYASLNDSLARIGLQKTYAKNKVEILELERVSKVRSSPPLLILILISLTLSQVIGIFSIYVYELFKPTQIIAPY
jgi:uncharacterized protein involved in exopolysaccharide biosynthesis